MTTAVQTKITVPSLVQKIAAVDGVIAATLIARGRAPQGPVVYGPSEGLVLKAEQVEIRLNAEAIAMSIANALPDSVRVATNTEVGGHTRISCYPIDDHLSLVIFTPVGHSVAKSLVRMSRRFTAKFTKLRTAEAAAA